MSDWRLSSCTDDFREEERRHRSRGEESSSAGASSDGASELSADELELLKRYGLNVPSSGALV